MIAKCSSSVPVIRWTSFMIYVYELSNDLPSLNILDDVFAGFMRLTSYWRRIVSRHGSLSLNFYQLLAKHTKIATKTWLKYVLTIGFCVRRPFLFFSSLHRLHRAQNIDFFLNRIFLGLPTFSKSLLGNFFPCSFLRNSWPNFCKLENVHSAESWVPSNSSSVSPCMAMLKLKPGDGSAPGKDPCHR